MPIATAALTAAVALTIGTAGPAQADGTSGYHGCSTTGASGGYDFSNYYGPDARVKLSFRLYDTQADGHHVRIRLISKNVHGTIKRWGWRSHTGGSGTSQTWETYAEDSSGLFDIGVEVARFEGNTMLNQCFDW
ncbi:hypothetical protein HW130_16230 [Streptomyces sp. PKU-EA00015]|uniref:hypothetical protein n=1 Tax=Streptomyces sp. PKU-EA00015 TaxID=2748326 RepID=UPI0015A164D7|nr:hypothetical protein [Streptomyces sp. PKU-EA00015]NWF27793.1 hypothetical protein [Streptomyces sp. PKU-EA00015]